MIPLLLKVMSPLLNLIFQILDEAAQSSGDAIVATAGKGLRENERGLVLQMTEAGLRLGAGSHCLHCRGNPFLRKIVILRTGVLMQSANPAAAQINSPGPGVVQQNRKVRIFQHTSPQYSEK